MKKNNFTKILIAFGFVFIIVLTLSSPLFFVENVNVTGNSKLSEAEILEACGLNKTVNILSFSKSKARSMLLKNTYIDTVLIEKEIFSKTVNIVVKEHILSGYVELVSVGFLYIDENGHVLEVSKSFVEQLPIVVGLEFKEFFVGQPLEVKNKKAFDMLIILSHLFKKYELQGEVLKVSLNDPLDTHLYTSTIDIEFGGTDDADEKVRTLKVILDLLKERKLTGFLDIKDINKPPKFRILQ